MVAPRALVYSNQDEPLFELDPSHLHEMRMVEAVNGEHSLTVTTTQRLEKTQRLLTVDETGKAREYVVTGVDEEHQDGRRLVGTYYAVWSLQYDLSGVYTTAFPGYDNEGGVSAAVALGMLLENTSRWSVGTVTQTTFGMASFYYLSGWKALSELVNTWGGEVDAVITVDNRGVASRQVCLHAHQGSTVAVRRFDYGADLTGVRRKVADDIITPRIVPLGKSQGTNGVRLGIADVNDGIPYLQDDGSASLYRVPDGSGGWEYPTQVVVNDEAEWPEQLLEWAEEVKEQYTRPKVTYEASVAQLEAAGMDAHGLALGDESQVVDRSFGDDGLRISGRVVKLEIDELDHSNTVVTLGYLSDGMPGVLGDLASKVSTIEGGLGYMATAAYLDELLRRINSEINSTGGWAYIVPGEGIITYDVEVEDPLVGNVPNTNPVQYANQVVQVKGGSVRIASAKKAAFAGINDWEWRSVFASGLVATDVLTATNVVTGSIEDAQNKLKPGTGNYWNLDTGELRMAATATVGGETVGAIASGAASSALSEAKGYTDSAKDALEDWRTQENVFNTLTNNGQTQGIYLKDGLVYINGTYIKSGAVDASLVTAGVITDKKGNNHWNLDKGEIVTTLGKIGGFTIAEKAIYSNLASLSGRADAGVYLGTDGIATSQGDTRLSIAEGAISAHVGKELVGTIEAAGKVRIATGGYELGEDGRTAVPEHAEKDATRLKADALVLDAGDVAVRSGSGGLVKGWTGDRSACQLVADFDKWEEFDASGDKALGVRIAETWLRAESGIVVDHGSTRDQKHKFYTAKQVDRFLDGKVAAEKGKGLTSNDFTDSYKGKLDGIQAGAQVNPDLSGYAEKGHTHSEYADASHGHEMSAVNGLSGALGGKLDSSGSGWLSASMSGSVLTLTSH